VDQIFHPIGQTGGTRDVERGESISFGGVRIVDLIALMPYAKFRADGASQQLHQLDPLFRIIQELDMQITLGRALRKRVFGRPSTSPSGSKPNPWSFGRR
jgi:hypothetical protein